MDFEKIKTSHKLEQILLNFIDVLRVNILLVDAHGNPVLVPKTSGYGFAGQSQWGIYQHLGTGEFLSKFQKEGHYLKSTDPFGFQSFAIPTAIQGTDALCYLIVGPVILNKQLEESRYQSIARDNGINFSDFLENLNEVRVISFNSLKSTLDLLSDLSQYALIETNQTPLTLYKTLLDLCMALTQAECGSIMLLNKATNELSIQVFKGNNLQKLQNVPVKLGEGIAGLAAQQKESFVISNDHSSNRIRHLLKKPELKCALVLPIINNKSQVLGVMNISTHEGTSRLATQAPEMLKSLIEITSETFRSH